MLSAVTLVVYVALIPAGLVLANTPERLALLAVAAVLLLRVLARHHAGVRRHHLPVAQLAAVQVTAAQDQPVGHAAGA